MPARPGRPTLAAAAPLLAVAAFALLGQAYVTDDGILQVDSWLANALHDRVDPSVTPAVEAMTMLGSTTALAVLAGGAGGYLVGRGRRRDAALIGGALIGSHLVTWILKASFQRPRPALDDPIATADWFSFPSGHAASSIALYGALAFVFTRGPREPRRIGALGGLALVVAAIGFSRLYLGVHYLSDVLAGYSVGLAWLLLAIGARRHPRLRDRPGPTQRDSDEAAGA